MWVKLLQIQRSDLRSNVTVYWNQKKATVFVSVQLLTGRRAEVDLLRITVETGGCLECNRVFQGHLFYFFYQPHDSWSWCTKLWLCGVPVLPCLRGTSHVYGGRLSSAYGGKNIAAKAFKGVTLTPETFTLGRRVCSPSWRQSGYFILLACMYLENMSTASPQTRKWCSLLHKNSFTDTSSAEKHVWCSCVTLFTCPVETSKQRRENSHRSASRGEAKGIPFDDISRWQMVWEL